MLKSIAFTAAALALGVSSVAAAEVGVRNSSGGSVRNYYNGFTRSSYEGASLYGSQTTSSSSEVRRSGRGRVADDIIIREGAQNVTITGGRNSFDDVIVNGDADITLQQGNTRVRRSESTTDSFEGGYRTFSGSERANFGGTDWNTFSETSTFAR